MSAASHQGLLTVGALGDTGSLASAKYLSAGVGLVTSIVAARLLGPTDFGLAIVAIGYCELLSSLTGFKGASIATHYLSALAAAGKPESAAAVFKLSVVADLGSGTLASVLALVSVPLLVPWIFPGQPLMALISTFAFSLPFAGFLGTATAGLLATGRFRRLAVVTVGERLVTLALVVAAITGGWGALGYVVARMVGRSAFGLVMLWEATRSLGRVGLGQWWRVPLRRVAPLGSELQAFFGWNYVSVTCTGVLEQLPVVLLGRFGDVSHAGFYGLARNLVNVATYLEATLAQVAYPRLSGWSASMAPAEARRLAWRASRQMGIAVAAGLMLGVLALPTVVPAMLGEGYAPMVGGAQVLLLGAVISAAIFWVQPYYYAYGRIRLWTLARILDTAVVVALMLAVVPLLGWLGLCWLLAVNRGVFHILMAWLSGRDASAGAHVSVHM